MLTWKFFPNSQYLYMYMEFSSSFSIIFNTLHVLIFFVNHISSHLSILFYLFLAGDFDSVDFFISQINVNRIGFN